METKLRWLSEVYPAEARATVPFGVRVNDMLYAAGLSGTDPVSGEPAGGMREQTAKALQHLRTLVERAGGSIDNVGRAAAFCKAVEDRQVVDEVWMELFPNENDKPAFKVLLADLPPGHLVRIDAVALLGGRRRRFDIPKVSAHDPTVRIGNWVFSSRCHGNDQGTGEIVAGGAQAEARQTLENLTTLMRLAGGSEADIVQITSFGRDDSYIPAARLAFEERFPDAARRPALQQLVNFVSPRMQVAMEMVAVLPAS